MAAVTTTPFGETRSRPTAPCVKIVRRQYQSCDLCRRNRRACDAAALGVCSLPGNGCEGENTPEACSSCARRKKPCTFNWLLSRPKKDLPQSLRRNLDSWNAMRVRRDTNESPFHAICESTLLGSSASPPEPIDLPQSVEGDGYPVSGWHDESLSFSLTEPPSASSQCAPGQRSGGLGQPADWQTTESSCNLTNYPAAHTPALDYLRTAHFDRLEGFYPTQHDPSPLNSSESQTITASRTSYSSQYSSQYSQTDQFGLSNAERASSPPNNDAIQDLLSDAYWRDESYSRFSALQETISQSTNKSLISRNLLRIYRGSLEHALSCWVTVNNCPYKIFQRQELASSSQSTSSQEAAIPIEFSVYARVYRLDEAFAPVRSLPLTKTDSLKASKALNAAILAFASQWSHVGEMKSPFTQGNGAENSLPNSFDITGEFEAQFERLIQESLWHEARRCLSACMDLESFKAVFAQMIFSMTQRPLDIEVRGKIKESRNHFQDQILSVSGTQDLNIQAEFHAADSQSASLDLRDKRRGESHGLDEIELLRNLDGPPTYLETALRHLASWRRRIMQKKILEDRTISPTQPFSSPGAADLQSFNMLFWLGVMCDTTSSVLTQRPLVITEEDCALESKKSQHTRSLHRSNCTQLLTDSVGDTNKTSTASELWGTYLLGTQCQHRDQARWPCTVEEAAAILQEAIPVKVLLFRRVAQLQALMSAQRVPQEVEDLISATLLVYQHWTAAYSQFMSDCIAEHENLPATIQSWYVILAGHWHLGSLLAAECILQIDDNSLSESLRRSLRRSSGLVLELKKSNAAAISDLALVSCASSSRILQGNDDFHFAFGQSALLTEPWTNVLMQALENACSIFLTWISCRRDATDLYHEWVYRNTGDSELSNRAFSCISALKLLGRKSEAASITAEMLETHLTFIKGGMATCLPQRI